MTGRPEFKVGSFKFTLLFFAFCLIFSPSLLLGFSAILILLILSPIGFFFKFIRASKGIFSFIQIIFVVGFGAEIVADSVFIIYGLFSLQNESKFILYRIGVFFVSIFTSFSMGTIWKEYTQCNEPFYQIQDKFLKQDHSIIQDIVLALIFGLFYRAIMLVQAIFDVLLWFKEACSRKKLSLKAFDPNQHKRLAGIHSLMLAEFIFFSFPMALICGWQYTEKVAFSPNQTWLAIKFIGFSIGLLNFPYFLFFEQFSLFSCCKKSCPLLGEDEEDEDNEAYNNMNAKLNKQDKL
jgi:hypothetical protein